MKNNSLLLVLLGFVNITTQTILLRELLIEVYGNEIIFAVFLSIWLLFIAIGSYISRFIKNSAKAVNFLFPILLLMILLQFYLLRSMADTFTLVSGQVINLPQVILLGLLIIPPFCFISGMLFPLICRLYINGDIAVKKGYIRECLGTLAGSLIFMLLIPYIRQFTILCLVSLTGFCLLWLLSGKRHYLLFSLILLLVTIYSGSVYQRSYQTRYPGQELISSSDSHYGRLDVTDTKGQKNYYWNGELFASEGNEFYADQMAGFVLLQHSNPQHVLMAGGLLNGTVQAMLADQRIISIDYLEMDQNIIAQADESAKLNLIRQDAIQYLNSTSKRYDLIWFDLPDPSSLFLNRFYTREFLAQARRVLSSDHSALIITLSNGANFMTQELLILNRSIYHTFKAVFKHTACIPAERSLFIGSNSDYITDDETTLLSRFSKGSAYFNQLVISEKCNDLKIQQFLNKMDTTAYSVNSFDHPQAYLNALLLWTDMRSLNLYGTVQWLMQNKPVLIAGVLIILIIIPLVVVSLINKRIPLNSSGIFFISLVNFVLELFLLNLFQMQHGYLYYLLFAFSATFMAGLACGFWLQDHLRIPLVFCWVADLILIAIVLTGLNYSFPMLAFLAVNIAIAFVEGYILASLLAAFKKNSNTGSSFYFLDSLGAMSGGFLFSVILLPVLGFQSCLYILAFIIIVSGLLSCLPKTSSIR